jgi:NlpC/P60 family putative phage cell wall peptidase
VGGEGNSRETADPARVLAIARTWLHTPYRHQGAAKGAGCDCLGLIRGVWGELYGVEPEAPPPYRPDWAEVCDHEPMLEAARRHLIEIPLASVRPGDVLLFRISPTAAIKHAAILSAAATAVDPHPRMIHAYWGRAVVESWLGPWWRRRLAAGFGFPPRPIPPLSSRKARSAYPGPSITPTTLGPGSAAPSGMTGVGNMKEPPWPR